MTSLLVLSTSMTLNDVEPPNKGFNYFLAIFGCGAHFKSELLDTDLDNLCIKFSA